MQHVTAQSKEVSNILWCDVLSKFMKNFLQPELCLETEPFSICSGMLMDITLEFWWATFRMQCWKVPTLDNLCAVSKYLSGIFLSSYYCFYSMFLIFLFTFYFTLFTCFFLFNCHQVPLGSRGSRAAGIGLLLLRACLTFNKPSVGRQRCLPSWGPRRTPWFFCNFSTFWCGRLLKLCFLGFWNYNSVIQALLVSNILCLFISTEVSQ